MSLHLSQRLWSFIVILVSQTAWSIKTKVKPNSRYNHTNQKINTKNLGPIFRVTALDSDDLFITLHISNSLEL